MPMMWKLVWCVLCEITSLLFGARHQFIHSPPIQQSGWG